MVKRAPGFNRGQEEDEGGGTATLLEPSKDDGAESGAGVSSKPGDQGIATQAEEPRETARVFERSAGQQEIVVANDALQILLDRAGEIGAEAVVDSLVKIVDVHPSFQMPPEWGGGDDVLMKAPLIKEIGSFLCTGCPRIDISPRDVVWLWKNKKSWTKAGVQVYVQAVKLGEYASYLAKGARVAVVVNFQLFKLLNTSRKVSELYNALRALDSAGNQKPPQFHGFYDSIALFGTGATQSNLLLQRAIEQGGQRELPFPEQIDAFAAAAAADPNAREDDDEDGEDED